MAMSVVYATINGEVIHENRGGVASSYMRDPLGNTIGLLDMNGNQTDSWSYWPYGEVQNHTGSSTTPLTFLGTLGYFVDFLNMLYVRARHLKADLTTWMTVDPLWPREKAYVYSLSAPSIIVDPSGLEGVSVGSIIGNCGLGVLSAIGSVASGLLNGKPLSSINGAGLACSSSAACAASILGFLLEVYLDANCPLCEGLAGCIGGIVASLVQTLLNLICSAITAPPENPCEKKPTSIPGCGVLAAVVDAVSGCASGALGVSAAGAIRNFMYGLIGGFLDPVCKGESGESPEPKILPG